jgi:hypothetical protein
VPSYDLAFDEGRALLAFVLAILLVLLVYYLWSTAFYRNYPCRRCKGKGRFHDPWFLSWPPWYRAWKPCPSCGGKGSKTRWGSKTFWNQS